MLCCDPNQSILEKVVSRECDIDFRYVTSEFPILTENGYGFLDVVGKDEKSDSIILLECKPDGSQLLKAGEEAEYYKTCIETYGLLQIKDLIGLYHRAIFGESIGDKKSFEVKPLIVDQKNLLRHSGRSFNGLFINYRVFMIAWVSRKYELSSEEMERVIPREAVPSYLIDRFENNQRQSYLGLYSLTQPLDFVKLETAAVGSPLKLEPDKTNYETLRKIESAPKSANRFSIQFHSHGHSRPLIFFEVDDGYAACFLHTGRHQIELNGYYESAYVLDGTERLYGLIEAEAGHYAVVESKGNRVVLKLAGQRCSGEIKLNFLDRIYLDDDIILTQTKQKTLENH